MILKIAHWQSTPYIVMYSNMQQTIQISLKTKVVFNCSLNNTLICQGKLLTASMLFHSAMLEIIYFFALIKNENYMDYSVTKVQQETCNGGNGRQGILTFICNAQSERLYGIIDFCHHCNCRLIIGILRIQFLCIATDFVFPQRKPAAGSC